jgi:hypothetical protein
MTPASTIAKKLQTPIGVVSCGIKADFIDYESRQLRKYKNGSSEIFLTASHQIELIEFKRKMPLHNGDTVTDTFGWMWRIEKLSNELEPLETYCLLDMQSEQTTFDISTGEHLDAIEASNDSWILHIGTEDGEIMSSRAANNDWFPSRLGSTVGFDRSITEMKKSGFITKIPDLLKKEKLHVQYLAAYDKRDIQKVNTWLAVDEFKGNLENWVGIR